MRKLLFGLLVSCSLFAQAQVYNNEWIDFTKTYYKFKVAKTGLFRIPQATLAAAGLGNIPAEQFQLWRNGVQVPIYTSVGSGAFSSSDYIEFWGQMNDGKPDRELYRDPQYQLNDKWSLISDTAAYFLTANPATAANLRLQTTANNVAANVLPPEPYFLYTTGHYFKNQLNPGLGFNLEDKLYSSSYDKGEGWTSDDITTTYSGGFNYGTLNDVLQNLYPYNGGPAPKFKVAVSGNSFNERRYKVTLNGDSLLGNPISEMSFRVDSTNFASALLSSGNASVVVTNITACPAPPNCPVVDRMVVHKYELTYARQFNFGGANNFEFSLPASASGNFLQIANFSFGSAAPVLYDLTNGKRYVGDISAAPLVKFVLQPSSTSRNLVLVSEEASNVNTINSLTSRTFINYNTAATRGDYLIISNPILMTGANPVEQYRAYRSSPAGGGYNAKVYVSDDLIDQFGFGINKNPAGIRNFILYAKRNFTATPKYVFIIGRGMNYVDQRTIETNNNATEIANAAKLNLVPTYGWPASDILLAAQQGSFVPEVPIGRLSAISSNDISVYLKKMQEYELAQNTFSPKLEDRIWMKNVVHIVGASDSGLDALLSQFMSSYAEIIRDTLFGAKVSTFKKTTTQVGTQLTSTDLTNLFREGISLMTYFGHSSANILDFNLESPERYNNPGKYPLFLALGCNVGDFFKYSPTRLAENETVSEKYVLAPDRGTIGFIASTHFGEVSHLNSWTTYAYNRISRTDYGNSIGEIMKKVIQDVIAGSLPEDFLTRANAEQTELHGDPALRVNSHPKPDYIVEDQTVKVSPSFISVADPSFKVQVKTYNSGKAVDKDIVIEAKRQVGTSTPVVVFRQTIKGVRYADSISFNVPINPTTDKGLNKLIITVDADNVVDEMYETNNSVTKEVMIYEDEARPVYPYNFGIVSKQNTKLIASTANPLAAAKQYRMELDTTELFNSPFKVTKNITAPGGILEFDPGITFSDSTVYYWRVALVPTSGSIVNWNTSSFVYLSGNEPGFNQSHFYQHLKSDGTNIYLDSASRSWMFASALNNITAKNGVFPTAASFASDFSVYVNGVDEITSSCGFPRIVVNVFDPNTLKAWFNANVGEQGKFGSDPICGEGREHNFQFDLFDPAKRKSLVEFLEMIPSGNYVVVRSMSHNDPAYNFFVSQWKADTSFLGSNRSIYHLLYNQGFTAVDSFNRPRVFIFAYRKNDQTSFTPQYVFSQGIYDKISLSLDIPLRDSTGYITSPVFGPSKAWKELRWRGSSLEAPSTDNVLMNVIGIKSNGVADTLMRNLNLSQQNVNLSSINAALYPFLQLRMKNSDPVNFTPYQLRYWRITYSPVPEGAIAPNLLFTKKDTLGVGENLDLKIAFKNVSEAAFDSVKVKFVVTDKTNVQHVLPSFKLRPLPGSDTLHIRYPFDLQQFGGQNNLFVEVNPDNDQPEQFHFNNFLSTSFFVGADTLSPLLDVTFDNVHILNRDIVSSNPNIVIKLKDESKFLITDPSTVNVQVKYPNGTIRTFAQSPDTLRFIPATVPGDNTASVIFNPGFLQDGEYELIVSGKDMSNNQAGAMQYRVLFQVINKPMISNLLNYPNPFTTSTAFVFTLTGSEVPQNFKIQILTVTGKVVREITRQELGPLRIGRNITEFKWDGTDQFGQKLGNGIYLYRVITTINGSALEKYRAADDNTDKFFKSGYGKMYLMR